MRLSVGRLTAVGSVDVFQPSAPETVRDWMRRGVTGLRLFTGGSTVAFDPSLLSDVRSFPTWELCGDAGLSMCLQTDPSGLAQVAGMAKRFPRVRIILDHLGRPEITDGPPYKKASSLFALAPFENVYLKLTPRIFGEVTRGKATPDSFFSALLASFGSNRMAWGSNHPASEGGLGPNLEKAKATLASLSQEDRDWIFGKTAQTLYPKLAD
ncbi:MAG TPA: amidohydrolase family protein [Bryobacteraceae bacterium]|nr:amidohydrolase family protein [Bryobacteraceae bacterium]